MPSIILTALAALSASIHIRAEYAGPRWLVYLAKPLTTGLLLFLAFNTPAPISSLYQRAVAMGLAFSLAGDVFLMLPSDRFLAGLASFLVAHLLYLLAFASGSGGSLSWWTPLPFLILGATIYRLLAPHLGRLRWPVIAYLVVILAMAWQAQEQWRQSGRPGAALAFLGAALFLVSDATLALNRFRAPFASAQLLILSTYYLAQWLIARSV